MGKIAEAAGLIPDEMLKEDFLTDYGLTQYALLNALKIPHSRLTAIIKGRCGITTDTALRPSRFICEQG